MLLFKCNVGDSSSSVLTQEYTVYIQEDFKYTNAILNYTEETDWIFFISWQHFTRMACCRSNDVFHGLWEQWGLCWSFPGWFLSNVLRSCQIQTKKIVGVRCVRWPLNLPERVTKRLKFPTSVTKWKLIDLLNENLLILNKFKMQPSLLIKGKAEPSLWL